MAITLKLKTEKATDKNGKVVKVDGQEDYKQYDAVAVNRMLSGWDSQKSAGIDDYKVYLKTKDVFEKAWREDLEKVELSVDEAKFLKDFLKNFQEKSTGEARLREFELRTLVDVIKSLEDEK